MAHGGRGKAASGKAVPVLQGRVRPARSDGFGAAMPVWLVAVRWDLRLVQMLVKSLHNHRAGFLPHHRAAGWLSGE
jgi:hypothetical protein